MALSFLSLAGQPGSAPGTTVLETVMMLFHHWPVDRATGLAPAVSSLGRKRVAGYTTPGGIENVSGASSGGCTHVSSLEGSRSAVELWTHDDELRVDPAMFPTAGVHPVLNLHSDPIFKGTSVQRIPAPRPAPGNSRWRPDDVHPPGRTRRLW